MERRGRSGSSAERRQAAYRLGLRAEARAALFLRLKGWRILARRYRAAGGEIDIIARRGRVIAFVEVKARATPQAALDAITPASQRRIAAAARMWQSGRTDLARSTLRFDAVLLCPRHLPRHIANAFIPEER
ncbi:YraN family protein [Stappia taiwanensis]|uniref:UPF0102 protein H1W37_09215 n=1 Tax=Stappia taiwanensis TaxID=992267 RepID=A0A838XT46_9HYPH|nr:YraN family protein [Stappia taiwanensis]MBA4611828.1 YraN family protein [Stappia taiwanensis]